MMLLTAALHTATTTRLRTATITWGFGLFFFFSETLRSSD
jgi:hypothetical protein